MWLVPALEEWAARGLALVAQQESSPVLADCFFCHDKQLSLCLFQAASLLSKHRLHEISQRDRESSLAQYQLQGKKGPQFIILAFSYASMAFWCGDGDVEDVEGTLGASHFSY